MLGSYLNTFLDRLTIGALALVVKYVTLVGSSQLIGAIPVPWSLAEYVTRSGWVTEVNQSSLNVRIHSKPFIALRARQPQINDVLRAADAAPNEVGVIIVD